MSQFSINLRFPKKTQKVWRLLRFFFRKPNLQWIYFLWHLSFPLILFINLDYALTSFKSFVIAWWEEKKMQCPKSQISDLWHFCFFNLIRCWRRSDVEKKLDLSLKWSDVILKPWKASLSWKYSSWQKIVKFTILQPK